MSKGAVITRLSFIIGILVLINFLANRMFFRLDFTADKRYTLSEATKNILKGLDRPITVKAYFSENLPPNIAKTRRDFREQLIEFSSWSNGKLVFEFINPNLDEVSERKAQQAGISPILVDIRERDQIIQQRAYLGAVVQLGEKKEVIPVIQPGAAMTQGEVKIGDLSIHTDATEIKRKIGYLPENNPLYVDMPVIEYLESVANIQRMEKSSIRARIREMIGYCGLSKEKHKKIGELSKGYRQRVGLAQAMIHDPELLILDEPTSGLDPNQIVEIRNLIKELGKEKTIILSTHILPEVEATCGRILIINDGKIVADGTPDSLRQQAQGQEVLNIEIEASNGADVSEEITKLDTVNNVQLLKDVNRKFQIQSKPDTSSRKPIFNLCVEKGWILTEMTGIETKLEDVFRELTT